jgi:protein-tyrosine phosphatase
MAEALAARALPAVDVSSAGTTSVGGQAASEGARTAMAEIGIDLSAHRSRTLEDGLDGDVAAVVVMTARHRDEVLRRFPELDGRVTLLRPDGADVADPYGAALGVYRATRDEIARAVETRLGEWGRLG